MPETSLSPVHGAFPAGVLGPPLTAGRRQGRLIFLEPRLRGFSLFRLSSVLGEKWLKPNSEKPRKRGSRSEESPVVLPAVNGGPSTPAGKAP